MRKWLSLLKNSMLLPKKEAVFFLNRSEMIDAIIYLLGLTFLATAAYSVPFFNSGSNEFQDMPAALALVYFFLIYFSLSLIGLLMAISFTALLARFSSLWLNRRLAYRLLWKTCTYIYSLPIVVFAVLALLFPPLLTPWLYGSVIYVFIILTRIIIVYPIRQ